MIVAGVELAAPALVFWRRVLAALALPFLLLALRRLRSLPLARYRLQVVGLGLLLALHWVLFFETVKRSAVAVAILTIYAAPIFLAALAPIFLPERRSGVGVVALAISAPGLALIALAGEGGSRVEPVAIAFGLAAALTYAALIIWAKR